MPNNPRSSLYLFLTDKLSALKTAGVIRKIDRYNSQISKEDRSRAAITPAVLIQIENKFESPRASNFGLQKGDVIITCHIDIDVKAASGIKEQDWDIFQEVYEALAGETPTAYDNWDFTPLERVDEIEDNNYDGRYHGRVIFKTFLQDCTKEAAKAGTVGNINQLSTTVNSKTTLSDRCEAVNSALTITDKLNCVLPTLDFGNSDVFDSLTEEQINDLTSALVVEKSGYLYKRPLRSYENTASVMTGDYGYWRAQGVYNQIDLPNPLVDVVLDESQPTEILRATRLKYNNVFGNKFRFTAMDGTQNFTGNVFKDHYRGWNVYSEVGSQQSYTNWINEANNATHGGFNRWRRLLENEYNALEINSGAQSLLASLPYPITTLVDLWTLTGSPAFETTFKEIYRVQFGRSIGGDINGSFRSGLMIMNFEDE